MNSKLIAIPVAIVAIAGISMIGKIAEDVDARKIVVCQYPITGNMAYWTEPGLQAQWWGRLTEYDKSTQVWFTADEKEGGSKDTPIAIQFNDGGKALISGSVRIELPTDRETLQKIQFKFGSMQRLMDELIRPTVRKAVLASGPMMTAYESYAEKKNDLMRYIEDQISNGVYQTKIVEQRIQDEISGEEKVVRLAIPVENSNYPNGIARQELPPFKEFGIKIVQTALNDLAYDKVVLDQIAKQQQIMMDMKTSYADALKAKQDATKEEEMGKARAAKAKWDQEEIKATAVTKAEQEREVAKLNSERAEFEKKEILARGQAEAEAARLKVAAGLSPLEKATIEKETAIGVAEALAKSNQKWVPEVVVMGGENKGGANPMEAFGLNMMMDLAKKMSK